LSPTVIPNAPESQRLKGEPPQDVFEAVRPALIQSEQGAIGSFAMKLERLDHYGLEVNDLKRAEAFYTGVLGFSVVARFGDQVLMECGGQNLALFGVARAPLTPAQRAALINHPLGKGHHAFKVGRNDFAQARATLMAAGVECAPAIDWGDHDCMYFLDLDGNLLELVSYR
jgi:catechol 2,3-dioxygenase-like lactoylglutathione lyase family enzyme